MSVLREFLARVVDQILNPIVYLISALAFVYFAWGVITFIMNAGDAAKRGEGRAAIMWGLVGLVIIFGVYGILNVAADTFGLEHITPLTSPN